MTAPNPVYLLRDADAADKEWIYHLNERCYRDVIVRQFGDWNETLAREHFEKKWERLKYQLVLGDDRRRIGILCVIVESDHWFLSEILIDPVHQNQGIGTRIVTDLIADAHRENRPLRLQVLRKNRARHWYARLGLAQTGETETHVLMESSVPSEPA